MRTNPGWHGYWLNPGDAGLPMDVKWRLPAGYSVGPLRYPVPTRLTVAGIMNYVYETDYAVLVRLKVPRGREAAPCPSAPRRAGSPAPTRSAFPNRASLRWMLPSAAGTPRHASSSMSGAGRFRGRWPRRRRSRFRATCFAWRSRCRGSVDGREAIFLSGGGRASRLCGEQHFRRLGDLLIAELPRRSGEPQQFAGVLCATATGSGLEFSRPRRRPAGRPSSRRHGREGDALGGPRRDAGRTAAQPDALRLPDPRAESAASGEERR